MTEFERDPDVEEGIRVTDKRRIDPQTGERREPDAGVAQDATPGPPGSDPVGALSERARVEELTSDLKRVSGEYEGAVKSVGDALEAVTSKFGLEAFGAVGEPFDPTMHEAMTHSEGDHEVAQISMVFALGYRLRSRVLRPARVGVEG